jgi:hypothetical protein
MIPDEIIRRRIPPGYGYRIPNSEFIDQQDPSFLNIDEYAGHVNNVNSSEDPGAHSTNHVEPQRIGGEQSAGRDEIQSPKLFPSGYTRRIAIDQTRIASDIRKYLSSNHVNPLGSSSYFENRRRQSKFSFSF